MSSFSIETHIDAAPRQVWAVLADIGSIADWHPGVVASHASSEATGGLGATRHCDLGRSDYLEEAVVTWQEDEALTMRVTETNLPLATADIHFRLAPDGSGLGTRVTVQPDYRLKYGILGRLLDLVFVRRTYQKGMGALLAGLKAQVEASEIEPA